MATMQDIAKKAGVSQATVSRVINGHSSVDIEIRQRVMEWVRKLNYQPNLAAQSLVKKQSFLLGFLVPEISNPYFSAVLEVVEQEAGLNGYNIIFCNSGGNIQKEKQAINILRGHQIDGLLIVPVDLDAAHLKSLSQTNLPIVSITRDVEPFDSVCVAHDHGGALVAKHLLELGHTNIAVIDLKNGEKLWGYCDTLKKHGIIFHEKNLIELDSGWEQLNSHEVQDKFTAYLEKKKVLDVTALFAYNDLAAFMAIHILREHGYRIPDDIAVVGFDNTFLASEMQPQLTSVAQPISEIGRSAVQTLLERLSGSHEKHDEPVKIILEPNLVVRESSRKPPLSR